jgi:hypothetical protein
VWVEQAPWKRVQIGGIEHDHGEGGGGGAGHLPDSMKVIAGQRCWWQCLQHMSVRPQDGWFHKRLLLLLQATPCQARRSAPHM